MKHKLIITTALAAALLLSACGAESNPDTVASAKATSASKAPAADAPPAKPTATPAPTPISPEELAKQSAASAGYAMKLLKFEDPGKSEAGYAPAPDTRFVAVQFEFENVSSDESMVVDLANATITDDNNVDYPAIPMSHADEIKPGDLAKNAKTTGWVGFTVPKDAKLKSATYRVGLISVVAITVELPKN